MKGAFVCEVILEIKVFDKSGKLIDKRVYPANLVLDNMSKFLQAFFRGGIPEITAAGIVDEGGVSRNLYTWAPYAEGYHPTYGTTGEYRAKIAIGTGTVSPTRADYALASKYAESTGITVTYITEADGRRTSANAVTITLVTGATISEIGFFLRARDIGTTAAWFLLVRDVLPTPIDVPDGGTISVTYKFTWG